MHRILLLNAAVLLPAAILDGAGGGKAARLKLSEATVNTLMSILAVQDCAQEMPPPWSGLTTHTVLPEQLR